MCRENELLLHHRNHVKGVKYNIDALVIHQRNENKSSLCIKESVERIHKVERKEIYK